MSLTRQKIGNTRPYRVKQITIPRGNNESFNDRNYTFGDYEAEPRNKKSESFSHGQDNYKFKIKLMGRNSNTASKSAPKTPDTDIELTLQKVEKLEMVNTLLSKKNQLVEQTIEKLRHENRVLKLIASMALEKRGLDLNEWIQKFQEPAKQAHDNGSIFPELAKQYHGNQAFSFGSGKKGLEDISEFVTSHYKQTTYQVDNHNQLFRRKLQELEDALGYKSFSANGPKFRPRKKQNPYESDEEQESMDLKRTLNGAIRKIKELVKIYMEYELGCYEQKSDLLENELKGQKKMSEWNENNFTKLKNNQTRLLQENMRIQRNYQDILRGLSAGQNSSYLFK